MTILAAGGPLLQLPTAKAAWWNNPNLSQQEIFTILTGHPVHTDHGKNDREEDVEHVAARLVDEDA